MLPEPDLGLVSPGKEAVVAAASVVVVAALVVVEHVHAEPMGAATGDSLAEQYINYTYPYSMTGRIPDILHQIRLRRVDGVIHYVQAFCHRSIGDIIFREKIDLPLLTLEGNTDYMLNSHAETRIEAFLDVLRRRQGLLRKVGAGMEGNL